MWPFYRKYIIFCSIIIVTLAIIEYLSVTDNYALPIAKLTDSETYLTHMDGTDWIIPLIERVREQDDADTLLIGDSVCRQLFVELADYNNETIIAPAIAPLTISGQYVLARLFIENHPNATDIYLLFCPNQILGNSVDINYSYQFLVMPLVETGTFDYLDPSTIEDLEKSFGKYSLDEGFVRKIHKSGLNRKLYLNMIKSDLYSKIYPPQSRNFFMDYFEKIYDLCKENDVTMHFLPCPVSDGWKKQQVEDEIIEIYENSKLSEWFPDYISQIHYYPEEYFGDDTHFTYPYNNQTFFNQVITENYEGTGLLEKIRFY